VNNKLKSSGTKANRILNGSNIQLLDKNFRKSFIKVLSSIKVSLKAQVDSIKIILPGDFYE